MCLCGRARGRAVVWLIVCGTNIKFHKTSLQEKLLCAPMNSEESVIMLLGNKDGLVDLRMMSTIGNVDGGFSNC
ncbi:hypothetical protein HN51_011276 [Arachis hypogaea]